MNINNISTNTASTVASSEIVTAKVISNNGTTSTALINGKLTSVTIQGKAPEGEFKASITTLGNQTVLRPLTKADEKAQAEIVNTIKQNGIVKNFELTILSKDTPQPALNEKVLIQLLQARNSKIFDALINNQKIQLMLNPIPTISNFNAIISRQANQLLLTALLNPAQIVSRFTTIKDLKQLNNKSIFSILGFESPFKNPKAGKFDQEDIKTFIKDSGLFAENKILKQQSLFNDEKIDSINKDQPKSETLLKLQMMNLLSPNNMYAHVNLHDNTMKNMVVKSKKVGGGMELNFLINFTNLGDVACYISFSKYTNAYDITVATEDNIAEHLESFRVLNSHVKWRHIASHDRSFFEPSNALPPTLLDMIL